MEVKLWSLTLHLQMDFDSSDVDSSKLNEEVDDMKDQLKQLTGSLGSITAVITDIKAVYDNYNRAIWNK